MAAKKATKYIFVTGGVLSGLGKGITAASIGNILQSRNLKINIQKLDPYLNVDAGTLNPAEHGECFVTKDGAETDLDLGHYERFTDVELTQSSSVMSGRILRELIEDERKGKYLGKTVQVIPHFTNAIQKKILEASKDSDVQIVEIGGTVGDYESPAFFEAIREMSNSVGRENCLYVHVVYLPYLGASKETKTKPAQNAIRDLRAIGIMPDILVARSEDKPNGAVKGKLSLFSGVEKEAIVLLPNAKTVYEVPLTLESAGMGDYICKKLSMAKRKPNNRAWKSMVKSIKTTYPSTVKVGLVAKYLDNEDAYKSVIEALESAANKHKVEVDIRWIDAETLEGGSASSKFRALDGIVVPGGFGERGLEGKIKAARYALDNDLPYLGLCLGLQMAVVAAARKAGLKGASSVEIDPDTPYPVVHAMEGQGKLWGTGGTMRLGNYECVITKGTKTAELYKRRNVLERHRHRYEVNNKYRDDLRSVGIIFSGLSPDGQLIEIIEAENHPFFIASQFHPEFKSRPNRPHPLFDGFIAALTSLKK